MKRRNIKRDGGRRQGVALIIVLGFLALMVIMAVAFLTHARMERLVSGSSLEAMRGRQLVRTALNAAMNDYSVELANAHLVMAPTNSGYDLFVSAPSGAAFGLGGRTIGDDNVELLAGEVEDWIPKKYFLEMDGDALVADAQWILVRENPSDNNSRILGRYAYACFDMSGGMDANLIANENSVSANDARAATNRMRRSVQQVPLRLLPEVASAGVFEDYRQGWKGFDSLYSLIKLTDGKCQDGNDSCTRWRPERKEQQGAALISSNVTDLVPFSLSAWRGGRYVAASASWTPYELVSAIGTWSTTLSGLAGQFGAGWEAWINNAIYDYTHNTVVPQNLDYPSPKNVPMFNELAADYRLTETPVMGGPAGGSVYVLRLTLTPEFWYPFPSKTNDGLANFSLPSPRVGGGVVPDAASDIWLQILPIPNPTGGIIRLKIDWPPASVPAALVVPATWNNGRPYTVPGVVSNFVYNLNVVSETAGQTLPVGATIRIQGLSFRKNVELRPPGGGVLNADKLPQNLSLLGANLTGGASLSRSKGVTDPRLNHLTGQWVDQTPPTIGAMNTWNAAALAKFRAEGTNLYCRNAPMETPAELGFISTGRAEWETIDLCTTEGADAMANLVADTNLFNVWTANRVFYTNGTINPNTRSSNVLASAFIDLSTHEVPNVDTARIPANPLDDTRIAEVRELAASIMAETVAGTRETTFQAGSDWARVAAMRQGGRLWTGYGLNNNQRESLIRNTWGLFSPDNSLFTVVVIAQAIKEAPAAVNGIGIWNADLDAVTGERRAVALVWRDPFKIGVTSLHHEMFVRMFRYLND